MEYLHKYLGTSDAPIHFYLAVCGAEPLRIFFTYQDLVRNLPEDTTMVYCFNGTGKKMAEFFVFRGLKDEVVITTDPGIKGHTDGIQTQQAGSQPQQ